MVIKGKKNLVIKTNQESSEENAEFEAEDKKYFGNVITRLNDKEINLKNLSRGLKYGLGDFKGRFEYCFL